MTYRELASYVEQHPEWADQDVRVYDYECDAVAYVADVEPGIGTDEHEDGGLTRYLTVYGWYS